MNNFITFTNSELEFLERLGIFKKGDIFQSNDDDYIFVKASYNPIKSYVPKENYARFEYRSKKGGTITFVRGNNVDDDLIPSVIFDYMGIEVAFGEKIDNSLYMGPKEEKTEEMDNILNNIRRITVRVRCKSGRKDQYAIRIIPMDGIGSTHTVMYDDNKNKLIPVGSIKTDISCIRNRINNVNYNDISSECYEEILKEAIETILKDNEILVNIFCRMIPLFSNSYEAALHLPSMNEKIIRNEIQNDRNIAIYNYDEVVKEADKEKNEILKSLTNKEKNLDKTIELYPVSKEKQK